MLRTLISRPDTAANLRFLLFSYRIFRMFGAKYGSESLFLPIPLFCPFLTAHIIYPWINFQGQKKWSQRTKSLLLLPHQPIHQHQLKANSYFPNLYFADFYCNSRHYILPDHFFFYFYQSQLHFGFFVTLKTYLFVEFPILQNSSHPS